MRIGIVGAGIVGVTTAYELAAQGHEVQVFERRGSVASETSFANAGVIAPGYVTPWAAPGMPLKVLRHLLGRHGPVRFGGLNALRQLPWLWRWWQACRPEVYASNRSAMQRLGQFSRDRLLELTRSLNLDYDQMPGYVVLLRSARELAAAQPGLMLLQELGVPHHVVDAWRCQQLEPGLNGNTALHAGIHLPQDGVGNCRHFALLLKNHAQKLGADFRFDTQVRRLKPGTTPSITTAEGEQRGFDAIVICAGVEANRLLAPIGLRLPLAPIYGYSVTAPLRHVEAHPDLGPRAALMDERYKVAITRLGQRIRVAGSAEIGGSLSRMSEGPLRTLYRVLDDWFPGAAVVRDAQAWKGARPMLPDGPPVLGASGKPGIWLNVGHGSSGWALACGSALVLAEQIAGRPSPIDTGGLTLARLR
ncbi:MAG TPA: D-amino acid dehydrogenase [Rubrivivax sp.]|nr:D-amino acid dehydrogenase [Rubrivivax sp.]